MAERRCLRSRTFPHFKVSQTKIHPDAAVRTQRLRISRGGLGHDLRPYLEDQGLILERVNPAELSPGEFACRVRAAVENEGAGVVVIDSLNGYLSAMPEEQFVTLQMHELLTYLNQQGVLTVMILAQQGLVGPMQTPMDLTYLSDAVLLLRFFEAAGKVRKAISVVKKRSGGHEDTVRELKVGPGRIVVGDPLSDFQGILSGVPNYLGDIEQLIGGNGKQGA